MVAQESERVDVARVYLGDAGGEEVGWSGGGGEGERWDSCCIDGGWRENQQVQRERPRGAGGGDRGRRKKKTCEAALKGYCFMCGCFDEGLSQWKAAGGQLQATA